MARLAAQTKMGYYPVSPDLLNLLLPRLKVEGPTAILDPCCGEGQALAQLATKRNSEEEVPFDGRTYAVELDEDRYVVAHNYYSSHSLNADFLGTEITKASFGFIWLNPPYDSEPGGGRRVEYSFLVKATPLLVTGGVMAMLLPESAVDNVESYWAQWFDEARILYPPTELRPYKEVLFIGYKRSRAKECDAVPGGLLTDCKDVWTIPPAPGPKVFRATKMTPQQRERALAASPLNRHLSPASDEQEQATVPMPLGKGHLALLLASGRLNGVVKDGDDTHVVRGTARKEQYCKSVTEEETKSGVKTTTTMSERIVLSVRTVNSDGHIKTLE